MKTIRQLLQCELSGPQGHLTGIPVQKDGWLIYIGYPYLSLGCPVGFSYGKYSNSLAEPRYDKALSIDK